MSLKNLFATLLAPEQEKRLSAFHILVVDANRPFALTLAERFQVGGRTVECATSLTDALSKAAARQPALTLIDVGDAGFDGFELAFALRERMKRSTVLVALSTSPQPVVRPPFDFELTKPSSPVHWSRLFDAP